MKWLGLLLLAGCGPDIATPAFYTSVGFPVIVRSDAVPLIEDVNAQIEANLLIAQQIYGVDLRAKYIEMAENPGVVIIFQTYDDPTGMSRKYAGQFNGRVIRVRYASGCMAHHALPHELVHLTHWAINPGYADLDHNDPGMWSGTDSFLFRAMTLTRFYCTSEFYDVYAQFEQQAEPGVGDP